MIHIGLDPNILTLGGFSLSWHGLFTAVAVLAAVIVIASLAPRRGISQEMVYSTAIWAILGGVVFSRFTHVIDHWSYYMANPQQIPAFWEGGTGLFGALLGGFVVGALYAWAKGYPVGRLADITPPGLLTAQMIGRIGCAINGDAYGSPTGLPWGFIYTHPGAFLPPDWIGLVATHPTPVYEILWDLAVLGVVWQLWGRLRSPASLFALYIVLYSLGRFFISFLREDKVIIGGLQQAHIISLLVIATGTAFLVTRLRPRQEEKGGGAGG